MFVPPLFKVSVGAIKTTRPLLFVKEDLVGLVHEVAAQKHYAEELGHLSQEFRVAVATRGHLARINK